MLRMNKPVLSYYGIRLLNKLKEIHAEHGAIIICYDFDDTVFDYSGNGLDDSHEVILALKRAKRYGSHVFVYTDLHESTLEVMEPYLKENEIPYDSINKCPVAVPFGEAGKPYYNILLDDKAGLGEALQILDEYLDHLSSLEKSRIEAERLARITPGNCVKCGGDGILVLANTGGMCGSNYRQAKVTCRNCSHRTKWYSKPWEDDLNIDNAIIEWKKVDVNELPNGGFQVGK